MPVLSRGDAVKRSALALVAVLAAGCAVGNQLVSSRDAYRLYRATRLAPTVEERLGAANRYLHVAPDGPYAPELRAWFPGAERAYVRGAHDHLPLLLAYAKSLPDGPSIQTVRDRIEELESAARFVKKRETARTERVESLEAQLARAAEQRRAFVAELAAWISELAKVRSYGQPLAALPADVLERFAVAEPAAGCPLDVCARSAAPRFAIPAQGTQLIPREAAYVVELSLPAGSLAALRLHGRELFSRVGEALDLRPVSFAEPLSRAEAIGRALSIVGNALGPELSADGCDRPAVSPVVLERACDGVHVVVTAAVDPGSDDEIAFGAVAASPPVAAPSRPAPKAPNPKSKPKDRASAPSP
jgi:hypothetical protein